MTTRITMRRLTKSDAIVQYRDQIKPDPTRKHQIEQRDDALLEEEMILTIILEVLQMGKLKNKIFIQFKQIIRTSTSDNKMISLENKS